MLGRSRGGSEGNLEQEHIHICRDEWEENCAAEARQVRVLGVCWGADKIPKRLEVLVPRVNPTGLDGWEKIKV